MRADVPALVMPGLLTMTAAYRLIHSRLN